MEGSNEGMVADVIEKGWEAKAVDLCEAIKTAHESSNGSNLLFSIFERDKSRLMLSMLLWPSILLSHS